MIIAGIFISLYLVSTSWAQTFSQWIQQATESSAPGLMKSIALARRYPELLAESDSKTLVAVLPSDAAWAKKDSFYKRLLTSADAQEFVLSAVCEVDTIKKNSKQIEAYAEANGHVLQTFGGDMIVFKKGKAYYGKMGQSGSPEATGKPLKINSKPVTVLQNASIFKMDSLTLPPGMKQ